MPRVLLVCPTFNHANLIKQTLDSMMAQTFTDWHLTIVDDGSSDDTHSLLVDYLEKCSKLPASQRRSIAVFRLDRNRGASAALNMGFAVSNVMDAKYETWVSSDNIYYSDFLKRLVEELDQHHNFGFVYSDFDVINEKGELQRTMTHKEYSKFRLETVYEQGMCFMWRKGLRERAGLWFDERLQCEDYNMTLRMSEFAKFKHIDTVLGAFRVHEAQRGTDNLQKHSLEAKKLYFLWKRGDKEGIPQTFLRTQNKAILEGV